MRAIAIPQENQAFWTSWKGSKVRRIFPLAPIKRKDPFKKKSIIIIKASLAGSRVATGQGHEGTSGQVARRLLQSGAVGWQRRRLASLPRISHRVPPVCPRLSSASATQLSPVHAPARLPAVAVAQARSSKDCLLKTGAGQPARPPTKPRAR